MKVSNSIAWKVYFKQPSFIHSSNIIWYLSSRDWHCSFETIHYWSSRIWWFSFEITFLAAKFDNFNLKLLPISQEIRNLNWNDSILKQLKSDNFHIKWFTFQAAGSFKQPSPIILFWNYSLLNQLSLMIFIWTDLTFKQQCLMISIWKYLIIEQLSSSILIKHDLMFRNLCLIVFIWYYLTIE